MNFLIKILVIAGVSFGLAHVLNGIHIDTFWTAFVFAIVLAMLDIFIKPLIILFTLRLQLSLLDYFYLLLTLLLFYWQAGL